MTPSRILTSITFVVSADRDGEVVPAYRELTADGPRPEGLLRSELLRGQDSRWLVQTLWRDREAVVLARASGVQPLALVLAERVGAEHTHDILTVEAALEG